MSSQNKSLNVDAVCDVVVVGSGAGGLSTAITATKRGLKVIVVEKEAVYGGTTAFSGGVLWVPNNPHAQKQGIQDSREQAMTYLHNEAGAHFDAESAAVFFDNGPKMVEFFEREPPCQADGDPLHGRTYDVEVRPRSLTLMAPTW